MNVQSNLYTILYSSGMVLLVAVILTIASVQLKPVQQRNTKQEKQQNILASLNISSSPEEANDLFKRYITGSFVINAQGEIQEGMDACLFHLNDELKKPAGKRLMPVFKAIKNDSAFIIIPLWGKGLWGPIWGYISFMEEQTIDTSLKVFSGKDTLILDTLKTDSLRKKMTRKTYNTIYGTTFDHKGETPGLGAEINTTSFEQQFSGKKIFDDKNQFVSVKVKKGGADQSDPFGVDAISGGTITSKGVQSMLDTCLKSYLFYFQHIK